MELVKQKLEEYQTQYEKQGLKLAGKKTSDTVRATIRVGPGENQYVNIVNARYDSIKEMMDSVCAYAAAESYCHTFIKELVNVAKASVVTGQSGGVRVVDDVAPPTKRIRRAASPSTSVEDEPPSKGLIYLYSDILAPSRVGDVMGKLLRIVPPPDAGIYFNFSDRYYLPLERTAFSNVTIMLTDKTGQLYPFDTSANPTIVTLHIKCLR